MTPIRALAREARPTVALAAPLAAAQLAQMAMSFVDVVMIGRLGPSAMAGAVLGSSAFFSLTLICIGTVSAVNPTVSQAVGAGDEVGVGRATRQGLWLAALLTLPLFALFQFAEPLLLATGQTPASAELAAAYLRAIRWGILGTLGFTALRGLCEGISHPRPVLYATVGAALSNAFFNWVLIFGNLGMPAMGVVGAGYASAAAMGVMLLSLALYAHFAHATRRFGVIARLGRPDGAALRALFRLGWPIGAAFGLEAGLFATATLLIGRFGEVALAAHQVALNAASVTFMVPMGIALAASVRVGHAAGRGDAAGAARAGWAAVALAVAFMSVAALLFWLRPAWVVWVYTGSAATPEVVRLAGVLLGIAAAFQLFDGAQVTLAGALRGLKDTRGPMVISGFAYWVVGMGTAVALGFGLDGGARGVWWGLTLGLVAAALLLAARFRNRSRAPARLAGVEPAAAA
jgi:MATE family multidrug resistance protein